MKKNQLSTIFKVVTTATLISVLSAGTVFAAERDIYNNDGTIFTKFSNALDEFDKIQQAVLDRENYSYELSGKVYDLDTVAVRTVNMSGAAFVAGLTAISNDTSIPSKSVEEFTGGQQGEVVVASVSAINKTKVEVTFSGAVDSVKAEDFTIAGASVTSATLSADKKVATLAVSGLAYEGSYTMVVDGVIVKGVALDAVSKAFTAPAVTDLWTLDVTTKAATLIANGDDNTVVTFKLLDVTTGLVDTNADNVVLDLNATFGTLANERVTIQDGQATLLLTSEFSNTEVTAKIDAQIIEASGDYKELIGKVVGTKTIKFVISDASNVEAVSVVSAESNQADRVTLFFDKAVDLRTFVKADTVTGELLYNIDAYTDADGNTVAAQTEIVKSEIDTDTPAENIHFALKVAGGFAVSQEGVSAITVQGIKLVSGNTKALEVILDKDTTLTDNKTVTVNVKTLNSLKKETSSDTAFKLTDARNPEVTSLQVEGLNTLKVKFSEAVQDATFKIDGQFTNSTFNVTPGEFNQSTLVDNRDLYTLELTSAYDEDGGVTPSTTLPGFFTPGDHSLQISSTKDFAYRTDNNNIGTTQNLLFKVVADASKPSASVTTESPEQFRVVFNKKINVVDTTKTLVDVLKLEIYDETAKKYVAFADHTDTADFGEPNLTVDKISDSEYVVELDQDWTKVFATEATKTNYYNYNYRLVIAEDAVSNAVNGMKNDVLELNLSYTGSALKTPDTTSAIIKSIDQVGATDEFVVLMDEPVKLKGLDGVSGNLETLNEDQLTGLPNTGVYFLGKDKDGKTVTVDGEVGIYDDKNGADKQFTVFGALQNLVDDEGYAEAWTVVVTSLSDDVGNTVATATQAFTVGKSATSDSEFAIDMPTTTTYNVVGMLNTTFADTVKITFTEGVLHKGEASDATNPAQYTLNGKTLPAGTDITVANADSSTINGLETVLITLPDGTLLNTSNVITVNKNLVSYDGTVLTGEYQVDFIVADGTEAGNNATAAITAINAGNATVANYTTAGITDVAAANLSDVNIAVADAKATKGSNLIKSEIQSAVNGVVAAGTQAAAITAINAGSATVANYTAAGVTDVATANLSAVNTAVADAKAIKGSNLTKAEIQSEVDDVVADQAAANVATAITAINGGSATVANYTTAVITGVTTANLSAVNNAVADAKTAKGLDLTKTEIQTAVDGVVASGTQAAAITAINSGSATEANYTTAGITGVTTANLSDVNTAVVDAKATKGSNLTKTEIQDEVDGVVLLADQAMTSFTAVTLTQTGTVLGGDVQYADAAAVISALPTTITVTLGDGTTKAIPVTWANTDNYDDGVAGSYTFTATWGTIPAGANNSNTIAAPTVDLEVAS